MNLSSITDQAPSLAVRHTWIAGDIAYTFRTASPVVVERCRLVRLEWPLTTTWAVRFDGEVGTHSRSTLILYRDKEDACRRAAVIALRAQP